MGGTAKKCNSLQVKECHEGNIRQQQMFGSLRKLMQCKLKNLREEHMQFQDTTTYTGGANVFTMA